GSRFRIRAKRAKYYHNSRVVFFPVLSGVAHARGLAPTAFRRRSAQSVKSFYCPSSHRPYTAVVVVFIDAAYVAVAEDHVPRLARVRGRRPIAAQHHAGKRVAFRCPLMRQRQFYPLPGVIPKPGPLNAQKSFQCCITKLACAYMKYPGPILQIDFYGWTVYKCHQTKGG
ncbi:MAG: hypothetical protein U9Q89_05460, partial [Thermodesulfobacteriota bacterium]|nr:hypothetical protein [Thermodesulfobacteriota bacterium]